MSSILVPLNDEQVSRLKELAAREGISVEELARQGLSEWLASSAERFSTAAKFVVEKNQELYERLAR